MKTGNEILDERKERALLNLQSAKEVVLSESQLQTVLRAEEYIHSTPLTTIQSTEPDTFNTVSHGRFSNNAVLYKQKDGEVSCAVIDWQEVCFQSLTIDVSTCIYSNLSEEDFREYEDDLLVYYIETFNQFLHPLLHYQDQIKILDLEVFRREQKINKFSIILSIVGLNGWLEDECKRERILKYLETIDS
ncbi:uncharacterized protein LOC111716792 [Eurytemora carolleeae]|uniref:uncharacterized protein LOC111716792 n=1 Tax=Eurytemora carolleeae TaxID=1294199 RepID=UPI000C75F43F|nr:uncharacterized protein LOC111716792 [Eurytemora carolleeae]|eukprot:XP_023348044.1 uncharacterized protein LOC111716792 [Eurytemora affinis]